MADNAERQHYRVATGQGLSPAPNPKPNPGYKKGGRVMPKTKSMKRPTGRGR